MFGAGREAVFFCPRMRWTSACSWPIRVWAALRVVPFQQRIWQRPALPRHRPSEIGRAYSRLRMSSARRCHPRLPRMLVSSGRLHGVRRSSALQSPNRGVPGRAERPARPGVFFRVEVGRNGIAAQACRVRGGLDMESSLEVISLGIQSSQWGQGSDSGSLVLTKFCDSPQGRSFRPSVGAVHPRSARCRPVCSPALSPQQHSSAQAD